MQSRNPILNHVETYTDVAEPMTVNGAIQKSILLTSIAAILALVIFAYCLYSNNSALAVAATLVGAIGGVVVALLATFKTHLAPRLAMPYALFEGAFLGGISYIFQMKYPGIPAQALLATFVSSALMFLLYKYRIIQATEKFKAVVISATLAILVIFVLQLILILAFASSIPYLFENNWLGLAFAAFVTVIATLNLILDFDLIESSAEMRAPKEMEWVCAIALLATLVWMYYSFLRLLSLLSDD